MSARAVTAALITLFLVIQAQIWFGRGSVPNVAKLNAQLAAQNQQNMQVNLGNQQIAAEVRDLKDGLDMIEEKARIELGMIKANEIFVQISR